ncbi:hypothetical protein PSV08DRAFT_402119, partial [Bipolaris maydis]|uniref:uncharacterized protein n=1 Tax=Cochliobolus heterostrophus TaxID=5016 RepID=UPI0024D4B47F
MERVTECAKTTSAREERRSLDRQASRPGRTEPVSAILVSLFAGCDWARAGSLRVQRHSRPASVPNKPGPPVPSICARRSDVRPQGLCLGHGSLERAPQPPCQCVSGARALESTTEKGCGMLLPTSASSGWQRARLLAAADMHSPGDDVQVDALEEENSGQGAGGAGHLLSLVGVLAQWAMLQRWRLACWLPAGHSLAARPQHTGRQAAPCPGPRAALHLTTTAMACHGHDRGHDHARAASPRAVARPIALAGH